MRSYGEKRNWALAYGEKPKNLEDTGTCLRPLPECHHCAHHSRSHARVHCNTTEIIQQHEKSENVHQIYYFIMLSAEPVSSLALIRAYNRDAYKSRESHQSVHQSFM